MEKIYSDYVTAYGDEIEQQAYYDGMSKERKKAYVAQYLMGITYKRPDFKDYNIDEAAQKIVDTYSYEEFYDLIKKLEEGVRFIINRAASDRIINAFHSIFLTDGKKSIKNAFMERCDEPSDINPLISSCISQTYKMLIDYNFLLTQQMFNKFFDNSRFTSDPRFKMVIDGIREQTGKLHEVKNEDVVRIIRNGIAHMNYVDNATTTVCEDLKDLTNNLRVKISSKDGNSFIVINGKFISMLSELMVEYLTIPITSLNFPQEYNLVSDEYKRMYMLKKLKELTGDGSNIEQFEKDFVKLAIKQNTENVLTPKGFSNLKTTVENPQFLILQKLKKTADLLIDLNKSRNKTIKNNMYDIQQCVPTLSLIYLYEAVSHLIDLELKNEYVDNNINNEILTKAFNTTKKKSLKNRFRLLRNCLAHGRILNYGYKYHFYDIDEKGVKIDLGQMDFQTILTLCEDIENYIMKYYDKFLEEYKSKVPTSKPDVM